MSSGLLSSEIEALEKILGYTFKDKSCLHTAICHISFQSYISKDQKITNERLEFLGNSILSLIIANRAFEKLVNLKEGALRRLRTKLMKDSVCSQYFNHLKLVRFVKMGVSERKHLETLGNDKVAAHLIKSILAAIYIDGGLEPATKFFNGRCLPAAKSVLKDRHHSNWRRKLQEICQKKHQKQPSFVLLNEQGPEHSRIYQIGIFMNDHLIAKGEGKTKKLAASKAASKALEKI
ncbi:MAG: Ribonuclease 3 [Chlamydiae bacterium]|nr:Ribonuclease 3 [Chlamydiota bacterium]